jgi:hypothetical protein
MRAMSVPPRTPAPSAIDGYRRIARTPVDPVDADVPTPVRVRRSRRVAGATRIAGLLAVIAVIAGASIGLATADPKNTHGERAAQVSAPKHRTEAAQPRTTDAIEQASPTPVAAPHVAARASTKKIVHAPTARTHVTRPHATPRAAPVAAAAPAAAAPATQSVAAPAHVPAAELPFTGAADTLLLRLLLGGATLTLLGMLVQIGGTPLPAQAIERKRLASRAT